MCLNDYLLLRNTLLEQVMSFFLLFTLNFVRKKQNKKQGMDYFFNCENFFHAPPFFTHTHTLHHFFLYAKTPTKKGVSLGFMWQEFQRVKAPVHMSYLNFDQRVLYTVSPVLAVHSQSYSRCTQSVLFSLYTVSPVLAVHSQSCSRCSQSVLFSLYTVSPVLAVHSQSSFRYTQSVLISLYTVSPGLAVHSQSSSCCTQSVLFLLYTVSPVLAVHSKSWSRRTQSVLVLLYTQSVLFSLYTVSHILAVHIQSYSRCTH